jgi:hypothetical protein
MVTDPLDWLDLQQHYPVWAHVARRAGILISRLYAYYKRCVQDEMGTSSAAPVQRVAPAAELPVETPAEGSEWK